MIVVGNSPQISQIITDYFFVRFPSLVRVWATASAEAKADGFNPGICNATSKAGFHFAFMQNETKNQGKTNSCMHLAIPRTTIEVVGRISKTQAPSMYF